MREVMSGETADGLRWSVLAGAGDAGEVLSFVRRTFGTAEATSGMAGPALYPGQLVNSWSGSATGLPEFILVRTSPKVRRLHVALASGQRLELPLSPVVVDLGLRFGAAPLPAGDRAVDLVLDTGTTT